MFFWVWIVLAVAVYFLFVNREAVKPRNPDRDSAEEILKMRYAKGELDDETFRKMREALRK